jgi:hypothetical protein
MPRGIQRANLSPARRKPKKIMEGFWQIYECNRIGLKRNIKGRNPQRVHAAASQTRRKKSITRTKWERDSKKKPMMKGRSGRMDKREQYSSKVVCRNKSG